jgi:hypothetical protein
MPVGCGDAKSRSLVRACASTLWHLVQNVHLTAKPAHSVYAENCTDTSCVDRSEYLVTRVLSRPTGVSTNCRHPVEKADRRAGRGPHVEERLPDHRRSRADIDRIAYGVGTSTARTLFGGQRCRESRHDDQRYSRFHRIAWIQSIWSRSYTASHACRQPLLVDLRRYPRRHVLP